MCEALVLIKKIQEDTALGYGTRISSKNIYLHVCRGKKKQLIYFYIFSCKTFI